MEESQPSLNSTSRRKLALVIGIDDYKYQKKLKNPVNDANDMASVLKVIGFTVTKKTNITHDEMEVTLLNFNQSILEDDIVLFYFSGHGVEWGVSSQSAFV